MNMLFNEIEGDGILIQGEGVLVIEEILRFYRELYRDPDKLYSTQYNIIDFSNAKDLNLSVEDIYELAIVDREIFENRSDISLAVVGKSDFAFGLARCWEAYSIDSPFSTAVFRSVEEACHWVNSSMTTLA